MKFCQVSYEIWYKVKTPNYKLTYLHKKEKNTLTLFGKKDI